MTTQNDVPATPSPLSHTDAAQALVDQTRAMRQQIPNFVVPSSASESRRLVPPASVPPSGHPEPSGRAASSGTHGA